MSQVDKRIQRQIVSDIIKERTRQDLKHGERNNWSPERWLVILTEEVGEVSHAVLERDLENYYEELTHVAAVAVAALECLSRQIAWGEERKGWPQ